VGVPSVLPQLNSNIEDRMSGSGEPTGNAPKSAEQAGESTKPGPSGDTAASADAAGSADASPKVAELESQIADLTDRLLRSHAEMDNIRKRAERERAETQKYAVTKFAADVLSIGDNLERARAAVPPGAAEGDAGLKALVDGMQMTERELLNVLSRHGVKPIPAKGEMFNPHLHQAVMEQQNADVPAGSIVQVFQQGYTIEDRVLRPSMVVVAKGGFKPVKAPTEVDKGDGGGGVASAASTPAPPAEPDAAATDTKNGGSTVDPVRAAAEAAGKAAGPGFGKRATPPGGERA
jgi:molecular chaperone GrpE